MLKRPGCDMSEEQSEHLFSDISPGQNFVEIESLCMQCQEKVKQCYRKTSK